MKISELLRSMCSHNLIVSRGYGRGMRYFLPDEINKDLFSSSNVVSLDSNVATSSSNVASLESEQKMLSKKRLSKQEMVLLMTNVCKEWVSLDDISVKIGKDYNYLRNHIIPQLLKNKIIEMLYPGTPNHPKQKYKVKD